MVLIDDSSGTSITVYLRKDEVKAIASILRTQPKTPGMKRLTRHMIVKFAVRRYLFPDETLVPLNGLAIELRDGKMIKHKHPLPPGHKKLGKKEPEKRYILKKEE